jgi:EPS-associated MarR family transcriptional regulator
MHYKLMRLLEANPAMSQRDAARALGMSVGKVNYCVRSLTSKGWVKAAHFKNSHNKAAYRYLLTPRGPAGKTARVRIAARGDRADARRSGASRFTLSERTMARFDQ